MAKFWKSNAFKDLKNQWDKKLEETGFVDIEKEISEDPALKQSAAYALRRSGTVEADARLTYYMLLAQHCYDERNFEDELDRLIMERTADGKNAREISDELKAKYPERSRRGKHSRFTIYYVRRRYENKWGIRSWTPEQMISRPPKKRAIR